MIMVEASRLLVRPEEVSQVVLAVKVVLLKGVPPEFRKEYELAEDDVALLRSRLKSTKVRCEGSLFFTDSHNGDCAMGGVCGVSCPFMDEIWILPDGSENHCPDPERRFGM